MVKAIRTGPPETKGERTVIPKIIRIKRPQIKTIFRITEIKIVHRTIRIRVTLKVIRISIIIHRMNLVLSPGILVLMNKSRIVPSQSDRPFCNYCRNSGHWSIASKIPILKVNQIVVNKI